MRGGRWRRAVDTACHSITAQLQCANAEARRPIVADGPEADLVTCSIGGNALQVQCVRVSHVLLFKRELQESLDSPNLPLSHLIKVQQRQVTEVNEHNALHAPLRASTFALYGPCSMHLCRSFTL